MDAIERAIRGALERGDANDRAHREKVYRAVFAALEKSISSSADLTEEAAQRRREALKARITEIEQEFQPAWPAAPTMPSQAEPPPSGLSPSESPPSVNPVREPPPVSQAPAVAPEVRVSQDAQSGRLAPEPPEPSLDEPLRPAHRLERSEPEYPEVAAEDEWHGSVPEAQLAAAPAADDRLYDREAAAERRRPWAATLIAVTVLAVMVIGGWWVVSMGVFGRSDGSVPNPPLETNEEDFDPEAEVAQPGQVPPLGPGTAAGTRDWITVFSPADPVAVTAPAGALADIMEEEGQPFIRIRSGESGAPVAFDVGQGILERVAGRNAVFDIVARAEEGQETQVSVQCDFGALGDCGRRRYIVGQNRADYLFELELPTGNPGGAGTISIVSDVANGGKAVDIFEIRVSVVD